MTFLEFADLHPALIGVLGFFVILGIVEVVDSICTAIGGR
jgi:hypothetical protein